MAIDMRVSTAFVLGALVVFLYWKWCEKKRMG